MNACHGDSQLARFLDGDLNGGGVDPIVAHIENALFAKSDLSN